MTLNTMSSAPETQNTTNREQKAKEYEQQIKQLNERLKKMEETQVRQDTKNSCDMLKASIMWWELKVQNVDHKDVNQGKLYRRGNNTITKQDIINTVNQLKEPFNTEISNLIKSRNILGLQNYLNQNIAQGKINSQQLMNSLRNKGIRFNGKILEDGKFWPQTLETIRFITQEHKENLQPKQPKQPEQKEEFKSNLEWIPQEIANIIREIKNTNKNLNRSKDRNNGWEMLEGRNFKVDISRKTVELATWGKKINSFCGDNDSGNRCEYHRDTGKFYTYVGNYHYELPVKAPALKLDKNGLPDGNYQRNREIIQFYAELGNLLNRTKNTAVFNKKGALEYDRGGIEVNNGTYWNQDTQEIGNTNLNGIQTKYGHLGITLWKQERIQIASLLSAAKLDIGKITRSSDIEKDRAIDPLDDEHKKRVKHYSHTKNFS